MKFKAIGLWGATDCGSRQLGTPKPKENHRKVICVALLLAIVASFASISMAQDPKVHPRFTVLPPRPATILPDPGSPSSQLAQWQGSFTYNGGRYNYTMVGSNPNTTNFTTGIQTWIVPVKMVYGASNGNRTFDPTTDRFTGTNQSILTTVLGSPVLSSGITFPEGKTQYGDAFQRSNFWSAVGTTNPNYHVLLQGMQTLPELTINVPANQGTVISNPWNGIPTGEMDSTDFDSQIEAYITSNSSTIMPNSLPIFIVDNVYLTDIYGCCVGGYHSSNGGGIAGQTYVVASAVDPVLGTLNEEPFSQDVSALSHEVGEWLDDPFLNNPAPPIGGCTAGNGLLEVGDPIEGFPDFGGYPYTLNQFTYHLQDLALLPFFGAPVTTLNNRFTFQGEDATQCNNLFAGALGSSMDTADNQLRVYNLGQDPGQNFDVHQFAFNGSWSYTDVGQDSGVLRASLGSPVISYMNTIYNGTEAFYLTADAQGNEDIEQLWGRNWYPNNLTDIANAQPAALGSGMVGFIDPIAGTDNVFYQGTDQHVHLLTWSPTSPWGEDTRLASAPVAAFGSALSGHMTNQSEEIFYIGTNQHVYELWRWSRTFDGWHTTDVTIANGTKPSAAAGSPLAGFYDTNAGTDTMFYVGTDQHVHELLFAGSQWSGIDVTQKTGAPVVGTGSTLAAHLNTLVNSEEVFFVNSSQAIQELWSDSNVSPTWNTYNMFVGALGSPENADLGSPLATDIDSVTNPARDELYYIGTDGNVHGLWWSTGTWRWTAQTP